MEPNPYAPPLSPVLPPPLHAPSDAKTIRREHLNTESNLKAVGILYILGGFILTISLLFSIAALSGAAPEEGISSLGITITAGIGALGIFQLCVGFGLRKLRPWARIPMIIVACLGLLAFPVGTLINGFILAISLGKKGRFVFTPEYQQIIAATPHIKRKTSIVVWILLAVLLLVLLSIVAAVLIPAMSQGARP